MQVVRNLNEIVYEPINQDYGWGKYGEFKVLIRRRDGYVNATKLCKEGGKEFFHWSSNEASKRMANELSTSLGIPRDGLFQVIVGGIDADLRGTYVHQDLVPHIASWISPQFAIKVSRIVNDFIVCQYEQAIREKNGEISQLKLLNEKIEKKFKEEERRHEESERRFRESERRYEETKISLEEAHRKLDLANENIIEAVRGVNRANNNTQGVQRTLDGAVETRVPFRHIQNKDTETYALYFCFEDEHGRHYTQCRARPFHIKNREKRLRERFPNFRRSAIIAPVPNARTLASEFERRVQERGAEFNLKFQSIILPHNGNLTEQEMVEMAHEVFDERLEPAEEAKELFPKIDVEIDQEGRITAGAQEELKIEPEPEPEEPTYEQRFVELMSQTQNQLREVAREFPRDKTFGGWSGKNKTDLAHWILRRQGFSA
jgi:hypothetical protein